MNKDIYANDLLHRFPGHSFNETIVSDMINVTLEDGGAVVVAEATTLVVIDAYRSIRQNMLNAESLPFLSATSERDALIDVDVGTHIFNITLNSDEVFTGTAWINAAGEVIDENSAINVSGPSATTARIRAVRFEDDADSGAVIQAGHSRGTKATPSALLSGDELAQYMFLGDDGVNQTRSGVILRGRALENWSPAARGCALEISLRKIGEGVETMAASIAPSTTAGETYLLIYDVDNDTLERVSVGAADSGGAGFKALRIPN